MKEELRGSYWLFCPKIAVLDLDDEGDDGANGAVVGLALRFALDARPTGSQGCAPGKANDEDKDQDKDQNKS